MDVLLILGALVAPLLYACTNHIDNFMLSKHEGSVLTWWIISLLVSAVPAVVIWVCVPSVLDMPWAHIGVMFVNGLLNTTLLWLYLTAMDEDEPTATITFYQLVPVFGLVLGYVFLAETFGWVELLGMLFVMAGTAGMVVSGSSFALRLRTVVLMSAASFCWAGETTITKWIALEEGLWEALFWENLAMFCYGLLALLLPAVRQSVRQVLDQPGSILTWSGVNEGIYIVGNVFATFMVTLVPVAMNLLFNTFQTFFVLGIGLVIAYFKPEYETGLSKETVWKYIACIAITAVGVYLIGEWE